VSDVGRKWTLHEKPAALGAPLCPHCDKPKTPGWTDEEMHRGRRFDAPTNTMQYHCYEAYVDD